jgi:hypothetical protein
MTNNYPAQNIMTALRWSELEYSNFQMETGFEYLEQYIPTDKLGIHMLTRSRVFWNWWKNHWAQRDEEFLEIICPNTQAQTLQRLYQKTHNPKRLIDTIYPNAVVLEESYAVMIGHCIKSPI